MSASYDNEKKTGLIFPLQIKEGGGPLLTCGYEEQIKQSLQILLLTSRGERVMRPGFGSGLSDYLFEGIDLSITSLIKYEIETTVKYYEPRVELLNVQVNSNPKDQGVIHLELNYRIKSSGTTDQLALTIN
ncbi:MAG: GPW/gp25 family protein [Clostridiales bacterium]|nr:GPW/gp25 family protein [Clostridiales bacterium]